MIPLKHTRRNPDSPDLPSSTPQILRTPEGGATPPAPGLGMSEFRSLTEQVPRELNSLHDRALPRASPGRGASVSSPFLIGMTLVGPIYYSQNTYIFTDLVYRKAFSEGPAGNSARAGRSASSLCVSYLWIIVDPLTYGHRRPRSSSICVFGSSSTPGHRRPEKMDPLPRLRGAFLAFF